MTHTGALPQQRPFLTVVREVRSGATELFGGYKSGDGEVKLPVGSSALRFSFAALTYGNPADTTYQFLLDGADKNWSLWDKQSEANYSGLGPVNACADDPRACGAEKQINSLLIAPLRTGQTTVGAIVLAHTGNAEPYSAANLKLLNTIALQTATAIRNAVQCIQMVETARARAAYAAELQAASTVQQMLMQGASRPTPGFTVESVYLPASEVGGDFFFVHPARDGSLLATAGDVSGKGLTSAMRVSMILGVLRREVSDEPAEILFNLNNALVDQGQLGFTTACTVRIRTDGAFSLANAGHIAPYLSGVELATTAALPLGIVPDQVYEPVKGLMRLEDRMVLVSDGVPEARSQMQGLLGFERLAELSRLPVAQIVDAACSFGQEDDITVVALQLAAVGL